MVRVAGELDVETLMGKAQANRAGFTGLRVLVTMDADMSRAERSDPSLVRAMLTCAMVAGVSRRFHNRRLVP